MSAEILAEIFLPMSLLLMMVGMGSSLTVRDFTLLLEQKTSLLVGLTGQLIILPLVAFITVYVFELTPYFAIGLILISVSPGGIASNVVSFYIRGNTALSIGMTAVSSMISVFTIPLYVNFAILLFAKSQNQLLSLPIFETFTLLASVTILPAIVGMSIRQFVPDVATKIELVSRKLSFPFLCLMMLIVVISQFTFFIKNFAETTLPLLLFLSVMVFFAVLLGKLFKLDSRDQKTIIVEVSLQNTTMALMVAITLLGEIKYAIVPGCYGILMFVALFISLWIFNRNFSETTQNAVEFT